MRNNLLVSRVSSHKNSVAFSNSFKARMVMSWGFPIGVGINVSIIILSGAWTLVHERKGL